MYPLRARTTRFRCFARISSGFHPGLADAAKANKYWFRSSSTICRAAVLACAGALAVNNSPPVHCERSRSCELIIAAGLSLCWRAGSSIADITATT